MSEMNEFLKDYIFSGIDDEGLTSNDEEILRCIYGKGYNKTADMLEWEKPVEGEIVSLFTGEVSNIAAGTEQLDSTLEDSISPEARKELYKLKSIYYGYWITKLDCPYTGWNAGIESMASENGCYGCLDCQFYTYQCLVQALPALRYWNIVKVRIPGHSAVAVYEKGETVFEGFIFDPWKTQSPVVYRFHEWPFTLKFLVRKETI